jgi:hypothetical protein
MKLNFTDVTRHFNVTGDKGQTYRVTHHVWHSHERDYANTPNCPPFHAPIVIRKHEIWNVKVHMATHNRDVSPDSPVAKKVLAFVKSTLPIDEIEKVAVGA